MKYSWIRIFISLLLIFVLLINISPIKAEAIGAGAALGVIKGATLVSVPVAFWVVAGLVALGVMVDVVTDPAYTSYDALVDNATAFLTDAGTYVKDGMVEMIRVVDETGKAVYYTAGDALESLRGWLFDSSSLTLPYSTPADSITSTSAFQNALVSALKADYACITSHYDSYYGGSTFWLILSDTPLYVSSDSTGTIIKSDGYFTRTRYTAEGYISNTTASSLWCPAYSGIYGFYGKLYSGENDSVVSSLNISLGHVPTVPIDGTGAREWSEEYTNNGLYIVGTGGGGNNNPNDGKWFWPLALGLTAAELYAMSQADQWAGETPSEFSDYEVKEDYSVSPGQEVEFGQSVELSPDSSANPDAGTGTYPDPGTSSNGAQSVIDHFTPSGTITDYSLDLSSLFPFCIPFDLYDFLSVLKADPVAPVFEFDLNLGVTSAPICIDLSGWSDLASVVRGLEVALFCIGLALKTKELIGT